MVPSKRSRRSSSAPVAAITGSVCHAPLDDRTTLAQEVAASFGGGAAKAPLNLALLLLRLQRYRDAALVERFETVLCRKLDLLLVHGAESTRAAIRGEVEQICAAAPGSTRLAALLEKATGPAPAPRRAAGRSATSPPPPRLQPHTRALVDRGAQLSRSALWAGSAGFYEDAGIEAWAANVVPCGISSNAFVADAYARTIAAHLLSAAAPRSAVAPPSSLSAGVAPPANVLELGSGHCRLGFLLAVALKELMQVVPLRQQPVGASRRRAQTSTGPISTSARAVAAGQATKAALR